MTPNVNQSTTSRRRALETAAWTAPTLLTLAAVPAVAGSVPLPDPILTITSAGAAGGGVDLYIKDTKTGATGNAGTSFTIGTNMPTLSFSLTDSLGTPLVGVDITIMGDSTKDREGNFMVGFLPLSPQVAAGESPTQRVATVTTVARRRGVKVATALSGRRHQPKTGTFTVSVPATAHRGEGVHVHLHRHRRLTARRRGRTQAGAIPRQVEHTD